MNHKRKGPKSTRSGCLMCKPQKHQANVHSRRAALKRSTMSEINQEWDRIKVKDLWG